MSADTDSLANPICGSMSDVRTSFVQELDCNMLGQYVVLRKTVAGFWSVNELDIIQRGKPNLLCSLFQCQTVHHLFVPLGNKSRQKKHNLKSKE